MCVFVEVRVRADLRTKKLKRNTLITREHTKEAEHFSAFNEATSHDCRKIQTPTNTKSQFLGHKTIQAHKRRVPPPSRRVGSCHCSKYCRHLPTPTGVMLKEHMGSPAMVSAPSCITSASGLNCARTSCRTLQTDTDQHNAKASQKAKGVCDWKLVFKKKAFSKNLSFGTFSEICH